MAVVDLARRCRGGRRPRQRDDSGVPAAGRTIVGMSTDTLIRTFQPFLVDERFCGPPGVANGGWLSGRLASRLPPGTTVEVTLRAPAPVGRELRLVVDADHQQVRLFDGDGEVLLAEARPADASPLAPRPVGWAQAALAESGYRGWWDHPFPGCFVCGNRQHGDGLRIFPGPVVGRSGVVAARWSPTTADVTADGAVPTEHVWAALDCPTGWVHHRPGGVAVLGRLTARLHQAARPGQDYIVMARSDGRTGTSGRRLLSRAAIYCPTGDLVATAAATWIEV